MTTQPLSAVQIDSTTRQKAMLALSFLALSTLGMIHPANAQEVTYIIFNPPGSANTQPNSINAEGAITGSYDDAQYTSHGFMRAPDGTITTFDPPGAAYTFARSINRLARSRGATLTRTLWCTAFCAIRMATSLPSILRARRALRAGLALGL